MRQRRDKTDVLSLLACGHLALRRYYRTLLLLEARFPIGKAKDAVNKLSFTWCAQLAARLSPCPWALP